MPLLETVHVSNLNPQQCLQQHFVDQIVAPSSTANPVNPVKPTAESGQLRAAPLIVDVPVTSKQSVPTGIKQCCHSPHPGDASASDKCQNYCSELDEHALPLNELELRDFSAACELSRFAACILQFCDTFEEGFRLTQIGSLSKAQFVNECWNMRYDGDPVLVWSLLQDNGAIRLEQFQTLSNFATRQGRVIVKTHVAQ